jgi:hypothetical protein
MWVEEGEEESGRQDSERGMDQVPKHLPSKIKVLSSNPSMPPKNRECFSYIIMRVVHLKHIFLISHYLHQTNIRKFL